MLERLTIIAGLVLSGVAAAQSQTERRVARTSECQAAIVSSESPQANGAKSPQAHVLSAAEARAIVGPWYSLFTITGRGDVRAVFDRVIAQDFVGCTGDRPEDARGREDTIKLLEGIGAAVPDMTFEIKELFVAGDRVIVRGEAVGTPAGDFLRVPHSGRQFRIMTIDILTVKNGKITKTYHLENWLGAQEQLRGGGS